MSTSGPATERDLLRTLLVGDIQRPEFAAARADLAGLGPVVEAAHASEAAARIAAESFAPQVIVLAEAYPGQIAPAEVERLRGLAPLARMVGLLGSWCEGETRTGKPWPGVVRVMWYEWSSCRRQLQRLCRDGSTWLSLPATATEEERLLARCGTPPGSAGGLVVVCSPRRPMVAWLCEACRHSGYDTLALEPGAVRVPRDVAAGIVDVDPLAADPFGPLRMVAAAVRPAQVIALLAFPRFDEWQMALRRGARIVLPSPPLLEDLLTELASAAAFAKTAI